jgi:hypothetical protein
MASTALGQVRCRCRCFRSKRALVGLVELVGPVGLQASLPAIQLPVHSCLCSWGTILMIRKAALVQIPLFLKQRWLILSHVRCFVPTNDDHLCAAPQHTRDKVRFVPAVCHTLNPRLFEKELEYIINHAQVNKTFFRQRSFLVKSALVLSEGLVELLPLFFPLWNNKPSSQYATSPADIMHHVCSQNESREHRGCLSNAALPVACR